MPKKYEKAYTIHDWRKRVKEGDHASRIDLLWTAIKNLRGRDKYVDMMTTGTKQEAIDMYLESRRSLNKYIVVERIVLAGLHSNEPFYWHTKDKNRIITFTMENGKLKLKRLESVKNGEYMWKDVSFTYVGAKAKWSNTTSKKWNTKILEMQTDLHARGIKGETVEKINEVQRFYQTYDKIADDLEDVIGYIDDYIDADMYIGGSEGQWRGDMLLSVDVIYTFFTILAKAEEKIDYLRNVIEGSIYAKALIDLHEAIRELKRKAKEFEAERIRTHDSLITVQFDDETPTKMQEWKEELRRIIELHGRTIDKILKNVKYMYEKAINS